jgi:DMSO/TMAO reductase YedYZ molybdopterin-dependent catalytic subunit
MEVAECYRSERSGERGANAAYIATVHPLVGLPLADLLDRAAMDEAAGHVDGNTAAALVVADTLLGIPAAKAVSS